LTYVLSGDAAFDERRNSSANFQPPPTALRDALAACRRGHGQDWYEWVVAYGKQEHRHDLRMRDGNPAACPVRGCEERGS
jgi:hypothetical protein